MVRWVMILAAFGAFVSATPVLAETAKATVQDLEPQAKQGDAPAQYALGILYLTGKDEAKAEPWLLAAAQRRHPQAQLAIAKLYADRAIAGARNGHVAPFDGSNAYYWLLVAEHFVTTEPDRASARQIRDRLAPMLDPALISQIERSVKPALQEPESVK